MSAKRKVSLIEDYESSSDTETISKEATTENVKKQKLLPKLSDVFIPTVPVSNPAAHQGRIRTRPHVDGQWVAHVYIPVVLSEENASLVQLFRRIVDDACCMMPELHSFLIDKDGDVEDELHISLSRPVYLRAHQREELRKAVKQLASSHSTFEASFASITTFINDERTRVFLSLEAGAGHSELQSLSDALTPIIQSLRQETYYAQPRFHASIAWGLLSLSLPPPPPEDQTGPQLSDDQFPSISTIPPHVVQALEAKFGGDLRKASAKFDVEKVCVKIGKEVRGWVLSG